LGKNIEVRASNRPIRIAYLIPYEETDSNHWIIDAVFCECYTRWSGARTLIVPTNSDRFLHEEYQFWLESYDPDFVYSYVRLEPELIERINVLSCPIAFIEHKERASEQDGWQGYLPDWLTCFQAVSSLSTIHSPYAAYRRPFWAKEEAGMPTVITQNGEFDKYRFIPDNFGARLDLVMHPNPVHGLYDTLCFTPSEVPERTTVGTKKTTSTAEVLLEISNNKALPIARLAMLHSNSVPLLKPYVWADNFNLLIGHTCLDRIHFWNARNLCPDYIDVPGSLLVSHVQMQDEGFVKALGQYLNKHNFLGQHSGPPHVAIRSFTHNKEILGPMRDRLSKCTHNQLILDDRYNASAMPTLKDIKESYRTRFEDATTFKLSEDVSQIQAKEPEHLTFAPVRFRDAGQWVIELEIERHNNLSKYSNVVDVWMLPRRPSVARAFTKNLARVSKAHRLALLPTTEGHFLGTGPITKVFTYDINLPDDEDFFRWLLLKDPYLSKEDLRSSLNLRSYGDVAVSDKGQNLRGVISMFESLSQAFELLTNRYWRNVLRNWKGKADGNRVCSRNHFDGLLPNDRTTKERLRTELRFENIGLVSKYLKANLTDTLELLIRKRIFFRVYQWRCHYCGHANTRTFEDIKEVNSCSICAETHFAPLDLEWKYELNDFVYRSLCERNGMTVLWALGQLQDIPLNSSFYYLPEVDLYPESEDRKTKNEIDLVCVKGGVFYAGEVKLTATSFIERPDEICKFVEEVKLIRPDIALLVFERYCEREPDLESTKIKLKKVLADIAANLGNSIEVQSIVASDSESFNEHPVDLGNTGRRTMKIFDSIERR
jgi:rubrerythrin